MNKKERVLDWLREYDSNMFEAWRVYCDDNCYYEDEIYDMEILDDYMYGCSATEIIDRCSDIDTSDNYFRDGMWGMESFNDIEDHIDIDALVDWIVEEDNDCGESELRDILDEYDDDEDDNEDIPSEMAQHNKEYLENRAK